jgi:uncharacterized protein
VSASTTPQIAQQLAVTAPIGQVAFAPPGGLVAPVVTGGYTDTMIASVRTAKARLSELLDRAAAGEEVIITSDGRPKAKLVPVTRSRPFRVNRRLLARKVAARGPRSEAIVREDRDNRDWEENRLYLDTAILLKLLVREPDSAHYVKLVDGQIIWSSQIILTECFSALLRKEREGAITATHRKRAWHQVELDLSAGRLNLAPLSLSVLEGANAVLVACHPNVALRSLDAIHLASASECRSWPLCTNDVRMRQAAAQLALPLTALPR